MRSDSAADMANSMLVDVDYRIEAGEAFLSADWDGHRGAKAICKGSLQQLGRK
jgi:hypothetical protein